MKTTSKKEQIQISLCRSSQGVSMTAMIIVAVLELLMLAYSFINYGLFGSFAWRYRSLYLFLLAVAVTYLALNLYVRKDVEHSFRIMNIANPVCAALFYAWSLLITYSDYKATGTVDATVFMTFSMVVQLGFYMSPRIYGIIVAAADVLMLTLILKSGSYVGLVINGGIFFIFQIALGFNYLRMKWNVARRIVEEQENALMDILTGCPNRRAYDAKMRKIREKMLPGDLGYVAIDLDGLKEVNDAHGHEAGDRLISGAAQCMTDCFGNMGQVYRIGGDEFAVLLHGGRKELADSVNAFKKSTEVWAKKNNLPMSASCGYACAEELSYDISVTALARKADERMYQEKARYYQQSGHSRHQR